MINAVELEPGGRQIGSGHPCFIAAEIGINHNGDMALARETIAAAAESGADGVKFQNYHVDDFLSDRTLTYTYINSGKQITESQYDMFKRCQLDAEQLLQLKECCDSHGLIFFSTPTSQSTIDSLMRIRTRLLKNGSDFLTNSDVVSAMARSEVPTVLSVGMATLADVEQAVNNFRAAGGTKLILLHCTSSYPTPPSDINLRRIPMLAAAFGCPVGFSDHSEGVAAAVGSVVLGACFVEKHFTLDRHLPGPDHWFSSDPHELKALVANVRTVEQALGTSAICTVDSESKARQEFRLSCVAKRDMEAGETLTEDVIVFRRPGTGIPPKERNNLVGMKLTRKIVAGQVFQWECFKQ